jgi:hypothetical protein
MKLELNIFALLILPICLWAQSLHPGYTNSVVFTLTNSQLYANGRPVLVAGQTNSGATLTNVTAEKIAPLTVASNTATTWNQGAGLIRYDTNYLYLSVGTNLWRRVGVTNF